MNSTATCPTVTPQSDLKNEYDKNGFVIIKRLFSENEMTDLLHEAQGVFDLQYQCLPNALRDEQASFDVRVKQLFQHNFDGFNGAARACQHLISLHQLCLDDRVTGILKSLKYQYPMLCMKPIMFFNSPHLAKEQCHYKAPVHQDWRSMQGSLDAIVVWTPLVDICKEHGPLQIIRGSHKVGLLDSEPDNWYRHIKDGLYNENDFEEVYLNAGDALFFSAFLIHRSGNNASDLIRWSIQFRFNNMLEPTFIKRHFPNPYKIYHPQQELITPDFPSVKDVTAIFQ